MKYFKWFCIVGLLLTVACEKERERCLTRDISINATIEQLHREGDDSKVVLINEEYVFWEIGDEISIASDQSTNNGDGTYATKGDLVNSSPGSDYEDFSGVFLAALPDGSSKFLGLHPYNAGNVIKGKDEAPYFYNPTLVLRDVQPLRNDSTFSRRDFPMVGWYGGHWDGAEGSEAFNLDFHSLAAIVRIQLYNTTDPATVNRIDFTETTGKKLSGAFTVNNFNTYEPYLSGGSSSNVSIDCGDGRNLGNDTVLSFYLVLPALGDRNTTTEYKLQMDVVSNKGHCIKNFTAKTRRAGITYMRAMGITEWSASGDGEPGLVGCGSATRPFKIYSVEDLQYLRNCYNSTKRTINNMPITPNTYIRIMRSDLVLNVDNWTSSINNFEGHITAVSAQSAPGITNNSSWPIFESVKTTGYVENLTVKSNAHYGSTGVGKSPLCRTNSGHINNCVVTTPASGDTIVSQNDGVAGICVTNSGTIDGCRCQARMRTENGHAIAGICLTNNGTIVDCQATAPMNVTTDADAYTRVAGICFENNSIVRRCYYNANINNSTASWGAIVYDNKHTVEFCYFGGGTLISTGHMGGIVHNNIGNSAKVNYCRINGHIEGICAGGIVDSLTGGKILNCYADNAGYARVGLSSASGTRIAGGLVAVMTGGRIENSYAHGVTIQHHDPEVDIKGGIVGKFTGGSLCNCYSYVPSSGDKFYGTTTYTNVEIVDNHVFTTCFLVDGSQTCVTIVTPANAAASSGADALITMLNDGKLGDSYTWLLPTGASAPTLDNH